MNYQREKKTMDKDDLKQLLDALSEKIEEVVDKKLKAIKPVKKAAVKKKTAAPKRAVKKKAAPKKAVKKKIPPKKKAAPKSRVKKAPVKPKLIPPREDFMGENKFVDDLTEATELIETDRIVCKKNKYTGPPPKETTPKICGLVADEKGHKARVGGCGKEFESYGGMSYLCDSCIAGAANVGR